MAYTDIDKPSDYFNTALYTGNYSTNNITSLDFQPDLVWIKKRSAAESHVLTDVVRGTGGNLYSNSTSAEDTGITTGVTSFNSDGFSLGANNGFNQSGATFASWNWLAGTSFTNDASATGIGSIDSAGSVNQDAGFSIISYTGTGSVGTVFHGLGAKPNVMIQKKRSGSAAWTVYHDKVATNPSHKYLYLNSTAAVDDYADHFNDTEPTSSVFTLGTDSSVNGSGATNIMYCFTEKKGYSKFGSYQGTNNVNGSYIHLGFKPAFLIIKPTNYATSWNMFDNKRSAFNEVDKNLFAEDTSAEVTDKDMDFLSNGFKLRTTSTGVNGAYNYIYMAFAESPFVTSTGVPACAR
tara:strand:- start:10 stop:1059 length:1050 start_codon:yes stop_codon:yes gene_type:complete